MLASVPLPEFSPANGPSNVISRIIKQKYDEPSPTWKKVRLELRDKWFREFKKEYRWDMEQDQLIRSIFDTKASQFQNKSVIAKANRAVEKGASAYCGGSISTAAHFEKMEKYKKRLEEARQQQMLESASSQNSHVASIDENEIYIDVVGSGNKKGNVYGLGVLSKRFNSSTSANSATTSQVPIVHQIEEMREIIQKLNDELMTKRVNERTLKEKMELLMKTHEEQSERLRKQDEQMQLILQHIQMKNPASGSSDLTTSGHHKGDHIRDDNSEED
ncbi:uncharacterized protein [Phaseolus vulgaris]|uniref:uncharacterized protein n=1 Tax=Phaseolus vulgaris TaxID=3885 RepID=UPI0035C95F54